MRVPEEVAVFWRAAPYWLSLSFPIVLVLAISIGGWGLLLVPAYTWGLYSVLDALLGHSIEDNDPETLDRQLFWYRLITLIWLPFQIGIVFGCLWYATHSDHMAAWEKLLLMFGVGVSSGTVGIVYAHELMHQKSKLERALGDGLMAITLYGHFRSEHLLVHHLWVGTPRDPVTARYNEGFHRFFVRVLRESLVSSWRAEQALLARKDLSVWHSSNPFWRYGVLQAILLFVAFSIGGWPGIGLFAFQAFVAVWQLELTNYVEHYGLTRRHLGGGKYEAVLPKHSWNSIQMASNWLLINLQRHSDHHYKPQRRFPLLKNWKETDAPQLPHGYPVMTMLAMMPPLWRRVMNPRVCKWRAMYYPEIIDWAAYKSAANPMPRGAS